jgi:protein AroM
MKIGLLTIGQSPRSDVVPELLEAAGRDVVAVERGALDGMDSASIAAGFPQPGDRTLVTRIQGNREVKVARKFIIDRMRDGIEALEREGSSLIVLLCTGEFDELESSVPMLHPDRILRNLVGSIVNSGTVGVMVPLQEQIDSTRMSWDGLGNGLVVEAASPYSESHAAIRGAAMRLVRAGADLLVLDCFGYDKIMRSLVREATGKPVLLPRTLVGRLAAELHL